MPGIRPVAPPIGPLFGVSQGQLPGGKPVAGRAGAVTLRALRRFVRPGGRVVLVGVSRPRVHGRYESCCAAAADGLVCVPSASRATAAFARVCGYGGPGFTSAPLALRGLRVPRQARKLVLRAQVPGVGRSAPVRVRLRR